MKASVAITNAFVGTNTFRNAIDMFFQSFWNKTQRLVDGETTMRSVERSFMWSARVSALLFDRAFNVFNEYLKCKYPNSPFHVLSRVPIVLLSLVHPHSPSLSLSPLFLFLYLL